MSGASLPNQPAQDGEMPQKHATIFVTANQPSCHVLAQPQTLSHTHPQEPKSAFALMPPGAVQEERHASSSTFATQEAVEGNTQPAGAPPSCSPLKQIITPLRLQQFAEELKFHTDPNWVKEILKGIDKGVSLGYHGLRCQRISRNLASASQHPQIIDEELGKEVRARRIVGPFDTPPIPNLQCSGVGVIPKKTGGWRMIMHLSAPPDSSINDGIDKEEFTLRYATIDDAVQMINRLGSNSLLAKIDIKSAICTLPVRVEDRELLGICWRQKYYVDCCLPFGLRSAPFIFNQYAEALEWILRHNYLIPNIIHYLDDFLIVGKPSSAECKIALQKMLHTCKQLGFPIAERKIEGPTTVITFLGILLDTATMELRLPHDKLEALTSLLRQWNTTKKKTTKRELLSLIGKLSFAAKVIPAGRIFLRRLIDLSTSVKKLHHHITLTAGARADIKWWQDFLPGWNGVSLMLQADWQTAADLNLFTDASGTLGFGAYFKGAWIMGTWSKEQLSRSIQWKELFAIVAAAATWGNKWQRQKIVVYCDNQAIVHVWQAKSPKNSALAQLCRTLFFLAAKNSFNISLKHLPGADNQIADALSRQQVHHFKQIAPEAEAEATATPAWLTKL